MDEARYRQLLCNRRCYEAYRLSEALFRRDAPSPVSRVVQEAATALRKRNAAEAAWERVAEGQWRGLAWVEGWHREELRIRVASAALRFEISRCERDLLSRLGLWLPGVRRIRIEVY